MTLAEQIKRQLEVFERQVIEQALYRHRGTGRMNRICTELGIHRNTLMRKRMKYGIPSTRKPYPPKKPARRETVEEVERLLAASQRLARRGQ